MPSDEQKKKRGQCKMHDVYVSVLILCLILVHFKAVQRIMID